MKKAHSVTEAQSHRDTIYVLDNKIYSWYHQNIPFVEIHKNIFGKKFISGPKIRFAPSPW